MTRNKFVEDAIPGMDTLPAKIDFVLSPCLVLFPLRSQQMHMRQAATSISIPIRHERAHRKCNHRTCSPRAIYLGCYNEGFSSWAAYDSNCGNASTQSSLYTCGTHRKTILFLGPKRLSPSMHHSVCRASKQYGSAKKTTLEKTAGDSSGVILGLPLGELTSKVRRHNSILFLERLDHDAALEERSGHGRARMQNIPRPADRESHRNISGSFEVP